MLHRDSLIAQARSQLAAVQGKALTLEELADHASSLAVTVHALCEQETRPRDREQAEVLARMMNDARGQVFTTLLTDRAYRSQSRKRTVEQARYLLSRVGVPDYVGALDRVGLSALRSVGDWLPTLTGTAMLNRIRHESSAFILPDGPQLDDFLRKCRERGIDVNVNHLGEEVLGEEEAESRVQGYVALATRPNIETLSIKISSIASQLSPLAFDATLSVLKSRLHRIFAAAVAHPTADGRGKRIVLDMEAYRDLELTTEAFQQTLDHPKLRTARVGIALQTYLPAALNYAQKLRQWSEKRVASGSPPIRIRLVKGANLAVERVEAALHGWRVPIYPSKAQVDANFKRVLVELCRPETGDSVHVGLASHNLFDVCFGLVLRASRNVESRLSFELLHGMAEPLRRTLQLLGAPVLVYAPIVGEHEFPSAIAYLVRRLDENTASDNYLRHSFGMRAGSQEWATQDERFRAACIAAGKDDVSPRPRGANRLNTNAPSSPNQDFQNEPDTDFAQKENRVWIEQHLARVRTISESQTLTVASRVAASAASVGEREPGFDPSRPKVVPYEICLAQGADIERALACAKRAFSHVPSKKERLGWLERAANALGAARGELIAWMVLDSGKRVVEADAEVSEAIDFANYYLHSYRQLSLEAELAGPPVGGRGPVVITPPWNFPLAIPLGGTFAALVAGNPVILKPALETPLVAQRACELLWQAGIPEQWLQFVVCRDETASQLITDARTQTVVLTGATETARRFLEMRPGLRLLAETGGKNALYISELSDHEQAVGDIVRSAFGHAGQKCSALSQLIVNQELYDSTSFQKLLRDATTSLVVGSAWSLDSTITPLIQPPSAQQREALSVLLPGESWLVQPRFDSDNPRLVSPGIKWGVAPGSKTHTTEFFCPLLAVLRADNVREAVSIANATRYGLTAGLHSLDEREQEYFIEHIEAGNLYVNRPITGAIVRRQPFGGWKDSSFGPGAKAGGPNYVAQFTTWPALNLADDAPSPSSLSLERSLPTDVAVRLEQLRACVPDAEAERLTQLAATYLQAHTQCMASAVDPSTVLGEDNLFHYRPLRGLLLITQDGTPEHWIAAFAIAASMVECPLSLLHYGNQPRKVATCLGTKHAVTEQALQTELASTHVERVRSFDTLPASALSILAQRNIALLDGPLPPLARMELARLMREQSVSVRFHRYGHLGLRSLHLAKDDA